MIKLLIVSLLGMAVYSQSFVYPTQDGITLGLGSYGYHFSFDK